MFICNHAKNYDGTCPVCHEELSNLVDIQIDVLKTRLLNSEFTQDETDDMANLLISNSKYGPKERGEAELGNNFRYPIE